MFQPFVKNVKTNKLEIDSFSGLNKTNTIADNEFSKLKNLSLREYPSVTPRKKRMETVMTLEPSGEIIPPADIQKILQVKPNPGFITDGELVIDDTIAAVAYHRLYYNGALVQKDGDEEYELEANDVICFNNMLYIFPDKLCCDLSDGEPVLKSMSDVFQARSISFKSTESSSGFITNTVTRPSGTWDTLFKKGDSIVISGCTKQKNNTVKTSARINSSDTDDIVSVIVEDVSDNEMKVSCYNALGACMKFDTGTSDRYTESVQIKIEKYIPDMSHVCVHNNRLWGTSRDGKYIYASKLGDFSNFNSFSGISTDSWWALIATDDEFTAITSYQNHVVAFKKNYIYEVYGDKPSNFQIPYAVNGGCSDGNSIAQISGVLFFTDNGGVSVYNGAEPIEISQKILPDKDIVCAAGVSFDKKYYLSAKSASGEAMLYVYDTALKNWLMYDETDVKCFVKIEDMMFALTDDALFLTETELGDETVQWECVTKDFSYCVDKKIVNKVCIDMEIEANSQAEIELCYDGRITLECCKISGGLKRVHNIPIRIRRCDSFKIIIKGSGKFSLNKIQIVYTKK